MATRRVKPQNLHTIRDIDAADVALQEIAGIRRKISGIEAGMNDSIDKVKEDAESLAAPMKTRLDSLTNGLLAYAEYNKEDLFTKLKRKTVELTFGRLGFRKSTKVKAAKKQTWKTVLERLKELKFNDAVTIKESCNKELLRQWPEDRLELVGARLEVTDEFWFEIKEEEVKPAA